MSFEQLTYKSGVLGQGCSLQSYLSRPGMLRCRLPAFLVLQLMDFGRWQFICGSDDIYLPAELQTERMPLERLNEHATEQRDRILKKSGTEKDLLPGADSLALGVMPLNTLIEAWWTADRRAMEHAVMRLQQFPHDVLKKRLSRILLAQLDEPLNEAAEEHWSQAGQRSDTRGKPPE